MAQDSVNMPEKEHNKRANTNQREMRGWPEWNEIRAAKILVL